MINCAKQEVERKQMLQDADQILKDLENWRKKRQQVQEERQQSNNQIDSNDEGDCGTTQPPKTDLILQRAMDDYENNMSMHKNIQDANVQHNSAKVQSIQ